MEILGHEYGFLFSVGAEEELAARCPEGNIGRMKELLTAENPKRQENTKALLLILSKWYEAGRRFEEPGYEPQPLTEELLQLLPVNAFQQLQAEAFSAMVRDSRQTVEAEAPKKNERTGSG